jgi:D-serine ammonia-lyase
VGRISQEHGTLTWTVNEKVVPLVIGQNIRIWPNYACIAGACYDWCFVFDTASEGNEGKVIDVWPR